MIEITILKVKHVGESEAKKLLQYMQGCDVWGLEEGFSSEETATRMEKEWMSILTSNESRSAFLQRIALNSHKKPAKEKVYLLKKFDYLFREKKPLVILERFSAREAKEAAVLYETAQHTCCKAMDLLLHERVDEFFQ